MFVKTSFFEKNLFFAGGEAAVGGGAPKSVDKLVAFREIAPSVFRTNPESIRMHRANIIVTINSSWRHTNHISISWWINRCSWWNHPSACNSSRSGGSGTAATPVGVPKQKF